MDPLVVFDCQKVVPDRFALTLAAAARSRALNRGAEPRLVQPGQSTSRCALHEIAAGAFTPEELAPFLSRGQRSLALPTPASLREGDAIASLASPSPAEETLH
ncbi:DNA-directed RNA polymerase subunit omega [compost metagenome]